MAAGDLALNILVRADASAAVGAVSTLGGSLLHLGETGFKSISNGLGNLQFGFRNLGTAGTIGMDALRLGAIGVLKPLLQLGATLGAIGVIAAIGIGVVAVHAAADFQQATTTLITSAGLSRNSIDAVRVGILKMSVDTATSWQSLTKGMFNVESALHLGAGGLVVLKAAAEGAKAENADLAATTDVLTTAMVNYHIPAAQAVATMNSLIVTVAAGKLHMNDLTGSLRNVLPVAAAFHIHLADVEGALATMANAGDRGTMAGTHLAMMFKMLASPVGAAKKEMAAMGLDSIKLAQTMQTSLPNALKMIQDAVAQHFKPGSVEYNRAILAILGGSKSGVAGLEIMNQGLKVLGKNIGDAAAALHKGGKDVENWSTIQSGFNFKMGQAKNAIEALFIKIGTALLPVLSNLLSNVTPLITGFTTWLTTGGRLQAIIGFISAAFSFLGNAIAKIVQIGVGIVTFFQQNEVAGDALKASLILVAIVVGGVLVIAFTLATIAVIGFTISLLTSPITWIIIAIIAVITGIILVITHWGQITQWIGGIFSWLGAHVHAIFSAIGAFIGGVFSAIGTKVHEIVSNIGNFFSSLGTKVHTYLTAIQVLVGSIFSVMGTKVHDALMGIATFFINKWNDLVSFIKSIPGKIGQALGNLKDILLAPFKWLYDHNWYVKAAVDAIVKDITNVKNFVGGAFDWLGTHIHDALTGIKNGVGGAFDWIGTHAHDFATGVKNTVGGAFDWLGTHVHGAMTGMKNTTGNLFDQIGAHARTFATGTKNTVGSAFDWIGTHVHDVLSTLGSFIGSKMSAIGSFFQSKLTEIKNFFGNIFFLIGVDVHNKITGMWNWITGFVSGWPSQAFQWGVNLIQGLINGIGNMFGNLKNMLGNIAGAIGNFLGFHSPTKEGPGREADRWAPNFIRMYVGGLHAGIPQVQSAFAALTSPATARGGNNAFALQGGSSSGAGGGYGVMNLQIKLDTRVISEAVGVHMAKEVRISGYRNR